MGSYLFGFISKGRVKGDYHVIAMEVDGGHGLGEGVYTNSRIKGGQLLSKTRAS